MAKRTFEGQKSELDAANVALRSFTLARRGANARVGIVAIARVNAVCERMRKLFATGPNAIAVAAILNSARGRVQAAEARLALLARKATMAH